MNNKNLYNEKSIESLTPLEFTRLRPGVYAGSTEYSTQLLVEILSNAIDEFNAGHGNKISVTIDKDIVTITDYGQGFIPNSFREDGKTILEAAFSVLNTSGKYRDDGAYEGTSLGSFGIGSKITTYLSHWLRVWTKRGGECEYVTFREGEFESREISKVDKNITGTTVKWQPSEEFFTHTEVDKNAIIKLFETITCLCPGLEIEFTDLDKQKTISYLSKNGLMDYVDKNTKDKELLNNRLNISEESGKNKINLCLTYTTDYSATIVPYVNTGLTDSGPHITLFKTIITREFNKFFREKKYLKDKDENLSGDDIQEGMYLVFNLTTSGVKYDAQVKSRVTGIDVKDLAQIFTEHLQKWLTANEKDIKGIAEKALNARKAREAAKKARDAVRNKETKKQKALKFDSKLADCYSKDRSKCEIYVTEGDSASGNLKTARNNEFQAVMPVRGKILNTQKATLEQIQKNAEIMTMIDAFGLTIDHKTMKITYKPEDLRYGKIIIMSDADVSNSAYERLFA